MQYMALIEAVVVSFDAWVQLVSVDASIVSLDALFLNA